MGKGVHRVPAVAFEQMNDRRPQGLCYGVRRKPELMPIPTNSWGRNPSAQHTSALSVYRRDGMFDDFLLEGRRDLVVRLNSHLATHRATCHQPRSTQE